MNKLTKTALCLVTGAMVLSDGYSEGAVFVPDHMKRGHAFELAEDMSEDDIIRTADLFRRAYRRLETSQLPAQGCGHWCNGTCVQCRLFALRTGARGDIKATDFLFTFPVVKRVPGPDLLDLGGAEYSPGLYLNRILSLGIPADHPVVNSINAFIGNCGLTSESFRILISENQGKSTLEGASQGRGNLWDRIVEIVGELGARAATYASYKIS
ncbi:MAG: hypothetical protein LBL30_04575 [Holosporales bacterium]|jgi:hypothetical protein|nr:hypothetical protein [Holosporales bacterium]